MSARSAIFSAGYLGQKKSNPGITSIVSPRGLRIVIRWWRKPGKALAVKRKVFNNFTRATFSIKCQITMKAKLSEQEQVSEHIQKLEPAVAQVVETLRQVILSTDPEIGERIKWNNPSFYYTGETVEFDPKAYKRDLIVMNLHKSRIMLVFPSGAKVNDQSGLLEGDYKDGRRIAIFKDLEDVQAKQGALQKAILDWLKLVEKE